MRRVAAGALIAGAAALQPHAVAQEAVFQAGTDLVVLQVAVVDARQHFIAGLSREDFAVYEDGVRQDVRLFASSRAPLDVMLLMDTSGSMFGRMTFTQRAAINLLRTLGAGDRASILAFSDRVEIAHGFTDDRDSLEAAVRRTAPGGATALYEALYVALRSLATSGAAAAEPRRRAIVLFTDGDDNRSHVPFDLVLEEAQRSGVTIFTVVPSLYSGPPPRDRDRRIGRTVFDMRQLAEETGGRAFQPAALEDLDGVYADIAGELGQQYWLAYERPAVTGEGFRRVSVRLEGRPDLRARTRSGYYASRAASRLR
jgi:Ca-activated chloride channel family protein